MNKQKLEEIEEKISNKYQRREKKKKINMAISGGNVKKLQKIIINKDSA